MIASGWPNMPRARSNAAAQHSACSFFVWKRPDLSYQSLGEEAVNTSMNSALTPALDAIAFMLRECQSQMASGLHL